MSLRTLPDFCHHFLSKAIWNRESPGRGKDSPPVLLLARQRNTEAQSTQRKPENQEKVERQKLNSRKPHHGDTEARRKAESQTKGERQKLNSRKPHHGDTEARRKPEKQEKGERQKTEKPVFGFVLTPKNCFSAFAFLCDLCASVFQELKLLTYPY